ncbi:hypothetical protein F5Y16DRAFT_375002 [Xylariaceae sp. FL0255]|nr:hypothetical protein F5Y16DRAFT_375002 [Xylariaceae sp. FL0255]
MSSSTTGLSRTRSLRLPTTRGTNNAISAAQSHDEAGQNPSGLRNASPSRLPVKPLTRSAATTSSSTTAAGASRTRAPSTATGRYVPLSSSIKGPTSSTARTVEHHGSTTVSTTSKPLGRSTSIRQAASNTTSYPPSTTVTRAASTAVRPKSSGGQPPSSLSTRERQGSGHSRAKSTVTTLTSATTLRPLASSHVAPPPSLSSSRTNNPSPPASIASSSTTSTTTTRTRHARNTSTSTSNTASHLTSTNTAQPPRPRPAFTTLQQHYSPAKSLAPKPLTSTFLAPPSPSKQPSNILLTAETSRLQTELLQLSLLHRAASPVCAEWHASAREKLGARFKAVGAADRELRDRERKLGEGRALRGLIAWGSEGHNGKGRRRGNSFSSTGENTEDRPEAGVSLDEKVQILDQVLNGVWALSEPGGRFQHVVRAFEKWVEQVEVIRGAQMRDDVDALLARGDEAGESGNNGGHIEGSAGIFISDLDAWSWKRDHAGLVRMLDGWWRMIGVLGDVPDPDTDPEDDYDEGEGGATTGYGRMKARPDDPKDKGEEANGDDNKPRSGLARTLTGCRSLVRDMLAELRIMEQIETDAQIAEDEWIENMSARLRAEASSKTNRRRQPDKEDVPPWKLLVS